METTIQELIYTKDKYLPKILIMDIETAPMRAYVWGLYKQNISNNQIISDSFILTWAAKWLFDDKIYSAKITPASVHRGYDKPILKKIWKMIDDADVVIAHNADKFDIPILNTRFLINGMQRPLPYKSIDTLKVVKQVKQFRFASNRLDFINRQLGLDRKIKTGGFDLWERCMNGDPGALEEMEEYNIQDVAILEELYVKLRPWIKSHPNAGLYVEADKSICPACGSERLSLRGFYYTNVGKYQSFRCEDCGSVGRLRFTSLGKKKRDVLTSGVIA